MAFITILTRHLPERGWLLERNRASLRQQTDPDYIQRVLIADARSFAAARQLLIAAAPTLNTSYVLILDDDDYLLALDALERLKHAARDRPPVIIFRGWHADMGVLPKQVWGAAPVLGDIGSFDFILRSDVFAAHVGVPTESDYAHDYALIAAAYAAHSDETVWLDRIFCGADHRRLGGMPDVETP